MPCLFDNFESQSIMVPTPAAIIATLKRHGLLQFREKVILVSIVGSFSQGNPHVESDIDVLLQVKPREGHTEFGLEEFYRNRIRRFFMDHQVRGKADWLHPTWQGRRIDLYLTYDDPKKRGGKYL